jgi:hypothetical protein
MHTRPATCPTGSRDRFPGKVWANEMGQRLLRPLTPRRQWSRRSRVDRSLRRRTFLPIRNNALSACAALALQPVSEPRRALPETCVSAGLFSSHCRTDTRIDRDFGPCEGRLWDRSPPPAADPRVDRAAPAVETGPLNDPLSCHGGMRTMVRATIRPGEPAPDFMLPAVHRTGNVSLADYRGRCPVLLVLLRGLY